MTSYLSDYLEEYFHYVKNLCALPVPPLQPLVTTDLFTVSMVLHFPECHIFGII